MKAFINDDLLLKANNPCLFGNNLDSQLHNNNIYIIWFK